MNPETVVKLIAEDDVYAAHLAAAFRNVVESAAESNIDVELFQEKAVVKKSELRVLDSQLSLLVTSGLLSEGSNGAISSNVMVHQDPHSGQIAGLDDVEGVILITDWPDISPRSKSPFDGREMVFPLHFESLAVIEQLASLPRERVNGRNCLDVFCGSGILGIYASRLGASNVVFSDRYSRSLAFTRLNSALNGLTNFEIVNSDSLADLQPTERFDLILANPPFEAVPDSDQENYFYHSFGGPSGEKYMRSFLAEVENLLSVNGTVLTVDFILSDATGVRFEENATLIRLQSPSLLKLEMRVKIHGQVPLRQFWVRFDALGIDRRHELLRSFLEKGNTHLILSTLVLHRGEGIEQNGRPKIEEGSILLENWCNPLKWPLPCGIPITGIGIDAWFASWFAFEAEHRSEQAAIHAESMVVLPGDPIEHWDFSWAFPADDDKEEKHSIQGLRTALSSTVIDLRFMAIATFVLPTEVALILLPKDLESGDALRLSYDKMPVGSKSNRTKVARDLWKETLTYQSLNSIVGTMISDSDSFLFSFTLMDPDKHGIGLLDTFTYTLMAKARLLHQGSEYHYPSGRFSRDIDVRSLFHLSNTEVQSYLITVKLPEGSIKVLEKWSNFFHWDWKDITSRQYFGFMRDRMTQFAIPIIMADQATVIAREHEQAKEREHMLNFASHTILGPAVDALRYLDWAEKGYASKENYARARLRISRLHRNAVTVLTAKRVSIGKSTRQRSEVNLRQHTLEPLLSEIVEDRALAGLPPVEFDFRVWDIETLYIRNIGVIELILTTFLQNACEHFNKASADGWSEVAQIVLRASAKQGMIEIEVENNGPPVDDEIVHSLNRLPLLDERHWGVSRKGADHYGIGVAKVKWLAEQLGGSIRYSKRAIGFSAMLAFPYDRSEQ